LQALLTIIHGPQQSQGLQGGSHNTGPREDSVETGLIEALSCLQTRSNFREIVSTTNNYNQTLAHLSILYGYPSLLSRLVDWCIDDTIADVNGLTALHYAYMKGDLDSVHMLRRGGASESATDKMGRVPSDLRMPSAHRQPEQIQEQIRIYLNEYFNPQRTRYRSVAYGLAKRTAPSLQRSGTTTTRRSQTTNATLEAPDNEDKYAGQHTQDDGQEFEEPGSFHGHDDGQQLYANASAGNSWQGSDDSWQASNQGDWGGGNQMEDLLRAMGGMDLQEGQNAQTNYAHSGPRFNPNARQASPNLQQQQYMDGSQQVHNLTLYTDVNQPLNHGPVSAGLYVPPIGHGPGGQRPVSPLRRGFVVEITKSP
jgi:hypothetical protein